MGNQNCDNASFSKVIEIHSLQSFKVSTLIHLNRINLKFEKKGMKIKFYTLYFLKDIVFLGFEFGNSDCFKINVMKKISFKHKKCIYEMNIF